MEQSLSVKFNMNYEKYKMFILFLFLFYTKILEFEKKRMKN